VTAIAVGQLSPGPTGLWSISLGYLTYGWLGAGLALVALSLPPLLVLGVSAFYNRIEALKPAQDFMRGISLGIIGLTLAVTFGLAGTAIVDVRGLLIALGAFALAASKKVPAVYILVLAAVVGCILYGW
jgi:chromate transporter